MNTWLSDDIVVNGISVRYYRTQGQGPPLVLAHGITDSAQDWQPLAQALEQDYDLIMYDARGHGASEAPPNEYTRKAHAADLAGLIEALGLERPALIGHSMGAANVATALATYPELARGAILEDPPWRETFTAEEVAERARTWRAELTDYKQQSRQDLVDLVHAEHPTWSQTDQEAWADSKLHVNPDVLEWLDDMHPFSEWQGIIRRIQAPTLVITGDPELDAIVTPQIAQAVTDLNPRIEITHIPHAGHSIRREQFNPYLKVVREFLKRLFG